MAYSKRLYEITENDFNKIEEEALSKHLNRFDEEESNYWIGNEDNTDDIFRKLTYIIEELTTRADNGDSLEVKILLKKTKALIDEVDIDIQESLEKSCNDFSSNNQPFNYKGYEFKKTNGRKSYKWDMLPDITHHKTSIKNIQSSYKKAESKHKLGDKAEYIDKETGQVFDIIPNSYSRDTITIKKI